MTNEAAAIIAHYLRQLAARSSLRWTEANERDPAASDANYQEWRRRQYEGDADAASVRRMTRR